MRSINSILFLFLLALMTSTSCNKEEAIKEPGTMAIIFDHKVGEDLMKLRAPGDQNYDFTDNNGQQFNISNFGYYISEIKFSSPSGLSFSDPKKITADPSKLTGFYHVLESDQASQIINVNNITARTYDKMEFTIGVRSYDVIEGTPGGILDPANGAWFLNMQAGYANLAIEGNASNSGQEYVDLGNGSEILEGSFSLQLSGWKDIAPQQGENAVFVDNTKTIKISFDEMLSVEEGLSPEVHINVDLAKILDGIDFSETYNINRPDQSVSFSNKFSEAFTLDFVEQ